MKITKGEAFEDSVLERLDMKPSYKASNKGGRQFQGTDFYWYGCQ